jgi:hypothetical protein
MFGVAEDSINCDGLHRFIVSTTPANLSKTIHREVATFSRHADHRCEAGIIAGFCRPEWICFKNLHNREPWLNLPTESDMTAVERSEH